MYCISVPVQYSVLTAQDDGEMLDRVNDFLVMLDAEGRCLAAAEQLARQQQESPQQELSGDSLDRNGKT